MIPVLRRLLGLIIVFALVGYFFILPKLGQETLGIDIANLPGDAERGAYVLRMAGCVTCHSKDQSDAAFLAGGSAIETPFGTFFGPNITPDPVDGIGSMTTQEFFNAVTAGLRPDGSHYYPAFPYASYTKMLPQDVVDLKAYLDTVPTVSGAAPAHELVWPFSNRTLVGGWKMLAYKAEAFVNNTTQDDSWNRGRYLVEGPGHCGECHTRRNALGLPVGTVNGGSPEGPFSSGAPAIAGAESAISDWAVEDIAFYLESGMKPDGDVSGGKMTDVIDSATSYLNINDLESIAQYLATQ